MVQMIKKTKSVILSENSIKITKNAIKISAVVAVAFLCSG
mgnify:CR=1 FL=1